jgi:hypothetical protein
VPDAAGQTPLGGRIRVVVRTLAELHDLLAEPAALVRTSRASVVVLEWRAPRRGWSGRLGPLDGVRRHDIVLPPDGSGRAVVRVVLAKPRSLREIATAALAALTPSRTAPRPVSAEVMARGVAPWWLTARPEHGAWAGALPDRDVIRPYDVVLNGADTLVPAQAAVVLPATGHGVPLELPLVVIDTSVVNPIGRDGPYGADAPTAQLRFEAGSAWRLVTASGEELATGRLDQPLRADHVATLRALGRVECGRSAGNEAVAEAALLVQLAATGVVLVAPSLPLEVGRLLDPRLRELLAAAPPGADALAWEVRSVRQRCAALRGHATSYALARATAGALPALAGPPAVSAVLLVTDEQRTAEAVRRLDRQTYPELEIVLGRPGVLAPSVAAALAACRHPARAVAADSVEAALRATQGGLVTRIDAEDVYGPEHVWDLVLAREFSGADVVGKAAEFVYLRPLDLTVRRRLVAAECFGRQVAAGALLADRGVALQTWAHPGPVDGVLRAGGAVYRTHPLGYLHGRDATDHPDAQFYLRPPGPHWPGQPADLVGDYPVGDPSPGDGAGDAATAPRGAGTR